MTMLPITNSRESFWKMTDYTKISEKFRIDKNLLSLKHMPLDRIQKVLMQYRSFTQYYIADLALLISKLPFGKLRTILADILNEELGEGDPNLSHPALYDQFLFSIGMRKEELEMENSFAISHLRQVRESLLAQSWSYGIGLRGMGGECLCQIYLATVYEYFSQNPVIIAMQEKILWDFWKIHTGEVDLHHQTIVRNAIDELLIQSPEITKDLIDGYQESRGAWERFWQQTFVSASNQEGINQ